VCSSDLESEARGVVDGLAKELLSNPLIEAYAVELLEGTSSVSTVAS
jgi:phosphoribosylformylglycinamidine (FGAM) synthase PurS component